MAKLAQPMHFWVLLLNDVSVTSHCSALLCGTLKPQIISYIYYYRDPHKYIVQFLGPRGILVTDLVLKARNWPFRFFKVHFFSNPVQLKTYSFCYNQHDQNFVPTRLIFLCWYMYFYPKLCNQVRSLSLFRWRTLTLLNI